MSAVVSVSRRIPSTPERLFDAWLDPTLLSAWMRREGDGPTTAVTDVRVGGAFAITMSHLDREVLHSGKYLVIDRPRTLEFTWCSPITQHQDSVVRVTFEPSGNTTLVSVRHELLPDGESARQHTEGWTELLEIYDREVTRMEKGHNAS